MSCISIVLAPYLFQSEDLTAVHLQSSNKQIHAVLVLCQQGRRRLIELPQHEPKKLGFGLQQGRRVGSGLCQERLQNRKQGGEDGLEEREIRTT